MANSFNDALIKSKLDWVNTFQRMNAVPLDRTSLFSSYSDAVKYAKGDGSDSRGLGTTSYVGQIITVFENDVVTVYKINADKTLEETGGAIKTFDTKAGVDGFSTSSNVGRIFYVSSNIYDKKTVEDPEDPEKTIEVDDLEKVLYPVGPYVVTGAGSVMRLATSSASADDLSASVEDIKTSISEINSELDTLSNVLHFVGVSSTEPTVSGATIENISSYSKGDVVLYTGVVSGTSITMEYVYKGGTAGNAPSDWEALGSVNTVNESLVWNEVTPAPELGEDEGGEEA